MKRQRFWKIALLLALPVALFAYIADYNSWRPRTIVLFPGVKPCDLRFSPDGRTLALVNIAGGEFEVQSDVLLCDVAARRIVSHIPEADSPYFLGKGELIAVSSSGRIKICSVPAGKTIAVGPPFFLPVDVLADGKTLLCWRNNGMDDNWNSGKLFRWDSRSNLSLKSYLNPSPKPYFFLPALPPHKTTRSFWLLADKATVVDYYDESENGSRFTLHFWDVSTRKLRFRVHKRGGYVIKYASNPGGLFAFCNGDKVEVWNCKTGRLQSSLPIARLSLPGGSTPPNAFGNWEISPDGSQIAGSIYGDTVGLWDINTGTALRYLPAKHRDTTDLAFSPDGRTLASCGDDGTIKLWRIK